MIPFLQFRANALASMALMKPEERNKVMSRDDIDRWIRQSYKQHKAKEIKG